MRTVYVLEEGEYSDRSIDSVWSNRDKLVEHVIAKGFSLKMDYGSHAVYARDIGKIGTVDFFDTYTIHTCEVR